jgi:hypothetical protein
MWLNCPTLGSKSTHAVLCCAATCPSMQEKDADISHHQQQQQLLYVKGSHQLPSSAVSKCSKLDHSGCVHSAALEGEMGDRIVRHATARVRQRGGGAEGEEVRQGGRGAWGGGAGASWQAVCCECYLLIYWAGANLRAGDGVHNGDRVEECGGQRQ